MSDDWAKRKFEDLKAEEGATHEETQRHAMQRHQLLADAPHLWRELRMLLQKKISEFNALRPSYLTLTDLPGSADSELLTLTSPKCELNVEFFPSSPRITFEETARNVAATHPSGTRTGTFIFVLMGTSVALKKEDSGSPVAVSKVAEYLLDFLV